MSSQRVKRKLQMPPDSQELRNKVLMPNQNDAEVEDAGHEPIEVLLRMVQKLSVISGRRALVKVNQIVDAINTSQAKELRLADAIKMAADKIMEAATLIANCMTELRPELKSLYNRNYREIQMSTNAVKQLVS